MKQLEEEGLQPVPEFLPLDVDSEESIRTAKETVEKKYGRLDILINNAGVLFRVSWNLLQTVFFMKLASEGIKFTHASTDIPWKFSLIYHQFVKIPTYGI